MRTHHSRSSGLDGMPLTYDAFQECSVLGLVCLDKWVWLSALHVIELLLELHTHTPGPDKRRSPTERKSKAIDSKFTKSQVLTVVDDHLNPLHKTIK